MKASDIFQTLEPDDLVLLPDQPDFITVENLLDNLSLRTIFGECEVCEINIVFEDD